MCCFIDPYWYAVAVSRRRRDVPCDRERCHKILIWCQKEIRTVKAALNNNSARDYGEFFALYKETP
jgi:hypothetical protein